MGIREMVLAMVIFGTIGIVRRYIPYPSAVIALVRGVVGALFLLVLHFAGKKSFSLSLIRRNGVLLFLSGALIGANWICLFEAYEYTTVAVATMCYYMAPVMVILLSPLVLREKLTLKKSICAAVAVFGMTLVSGLFDHTTDSLELGVSAKGIGFGLLAAGMYAVVVLMNKFIHDISAADRTLFQLAAAGITVLPYVLLTGQMKGIEMNLLLVTMLAIAGIVHTGIAYTLYFGSMEHIPAQTVALLSYLDPIVAVVLSIVILREEMRPVSVIGVVLVLGAMLLGEWSTGKKRIGKKRI